MLFSRCALLPHLDLPCLAILRCATTCLQLLACLRVCRCTFQFERSRVSFLIGVWFLVLAFSFRRCGVLILVFSFLV